MLFSEVIKFYMNVEVKRKILEVTKNREVVPRYNDKVGNRPDVLIFEGDIENFVRNGATSFHASMERWSNPLFLKDANTKKELDNLRIGWDLIFDIDGKHIDFSKIGAELICKALEFHNIKNYSVKFSGGSGFHIGVPYESFPKEVTGRDVRYLFPEAPRIIANYIKSMISEYLADRLLEEFSPKRLSEMTNMKVREFTINGKLDPFKFLDIDSVAISSRHLFRVPYTFNEKKWLVSIPIKPKEIPEFDLKWAKHENVVPELGYLDKYRENEAKQLFIQAFDFYTQIRIKEEINSAGRYEIPSKAIDEKFFPPCIKNIFKGLKDGRKRSVFILLNFLKACGWDYNSIEKLLFEWNKKNEEPLRESYIKSQLNWHKKQKGYYLPPACNNESYYKDIGVCTPDNLCKKIKNPLSYVFKKMKK